MGKGEWLNAQGLKRPGLNHLSNWLQRESEAKSVKESEVNQEESRKEADASSDTVCEGDVNSSTQGFTPEAVEEEDLGDDSFWTLLLRAGYTIW